MAEFRKAHISPNSANTGRATAGNNKPTRRAWHTNGMIRFFPRSKEEFDDVYSLAKDFVFTEHGPQEPVFDSSSQVLTMGSCFASELRNVLELNNKNSEYIQVPEGLNNSFAVRQYLEWVCTGNRSSDAYWYDNDPSAGAYKWEPEQEQKDLLEYFKKVDGFVITLGLAEVWRDIETGGVFWRGVPEAAFDPNRHECVTSTVEENVKNIRRIVQLIRKYAGKDKTIVFTLSPVPLNATFLGRPTIVSDCVSKSILRVALDKFFTGAKVPKACYYWPSYEMVRWTGSHLDFPTLYEDNTPRHVKRQIVDIIINNFISKFFKQE